MEKALTDMVDHRSDRAGTGEGSYDYVIVGGGTAGCVLAARLSESHSNRVLLLEAGADVVPGREPADILSIHADSAYNPGYRWPISSTTTVDVGSTAPSHQARVLGGGSSLMGMLSLRGHPADYDDWAQKGADDWSWQDVLPWFRKLESDADIAGDLHGSQGPVVIRRNPREAWPPVSRAFGEYAERAGLPFRADMNGSFEDGLFPLPLAQTEASRQSSSISYLTDSVRSRPNLRIETGLHVLRLLFDAGRAVGVEAKLPDGTIKTFLTCGEVIVSAGALLSPALLLRSGVGSHERLRELGIETIADLRGVGEGLQNHPMIFLTSFLPRRSRDRHLDISAVHNCIRYSSGSADGGSDLYILCLNRTANHPLGKALAALQSYLLKPLSRGTVRLRSADPHDSPLVSFNLLSDPLDMDRTVRTLRDMAAVAESPEMKRQGVDFFAVKFSARLRRLNAPTPSNAALSSLAALMLDTLPASRTILERVMPAGPRARDLLIENDERLAALARDYVGASGHHSGTCRMGAVDDPTAVVDPQGRVRGIRGLRVVDASIMPSIPRGNTNLPTVMIAEKLAARMTSDMKQRTGT